MIDIYTWLESNPWLAIPLPLMVLFGVGLWNWFAERLAEKIANDFGLMVMWMIEMLPPRWDKIILEAVDLMEKDIPDKLEVTPGIRSLSFQITTKAPMLKGHEEKIATLTVRFLLSLDAKAKAILEAQRK